MAILTLTSGQRAALQRIADTTSDPNEGFWTRGCRDGRAHARTRLADALSGRDADEIEDGLDAMDAECDLFDGEFYDGFLSIVRDVRAVTYPVSSRWALWSEDEPARLLDLISYDTGPVTEARAREGLGRAVVPITGRLEAIDQARLNELRKTHPNQQGARS